MSTRRRDPETAEVLAALSRPAAVEGPGLSRRRFLQASAALAGSAVLLPTWLADLAAAATPVGPTDGILVTVLLAGGNDGLNTVVPVGDSAYYAARGHSAIPGDQTLAVAPGLGLHSRLPYLKQRADAGDLAVVQGVGDPGGDLSHFTSMARWMSGDGTDGARDGGWLGRYLDGLPSPDAFHGVTIGSTVPLLVQGRKERAISLPTSVNDVLDPTHKDDWVRRAAGAVKAMGAGTTGLGQWGDALAAAGRESVDVIGKAAALYPTKLAAGPLTEQLDLCARVINADLGVRVLHTSFGSFDTHANLAGEHANRMGELDTGLSTFFGTLDPRFAGRVTVLTLSEFGRRVRVNQSGGTDHGTASALLAVGANVKGGIYGAAPSLVRTDGAGNLVPTVDHRSVFATVLDSWLGGDSNAILGGHFENLGFLERPAA